MSGAERKYYSLAELSAAREEWWSKVPACAAHYPKWCACNGECEHPWHFGDPQFSPYRGWLQCPVCGVEAWDGTHDDD